jgi:endonuclease/exonuclease/phosphatase family metal-dependent hydrolase
MKKWVCVIAAASIVGCFDEHESVRFPVELEIMTFNAGLADGFVDHTSERVDAIAAKLAKSEKDVVCLQEVWEVEHRERLVEAVGSRFEHVHYYDPREESGQEDGDDTGEKVPCNLEDGQALGLCVGEHCSDVAEDELAGCVLAHCDQQFGDLAPQCRQCLFGTVEQGIDAVFEQCSDLTQGGAVYGGHNGLLVLSTRPLSDVEHVKLEGFLTKRAVLLARVSLEPDVTLALACTHLSANLDYIDYGGSYESWQDERNAQIDALTKAVSDYTKVQEAVAVMGDFNCGPKTDYVDGEYAQDFQKLLDKGYRAPFVKKTLCTWCRDNPLVSEDKETLIDHILFKNEEKMSIYDPQRSWDEELELTVDGEKTTTRYSDHYAVSVKVRP